MVKGVKRMKWLFIGLGAALAAAAITGGIAVVSRKRRERKNDQVDGGVVKRYWTDAPKLIESREIRTFRCVISLLAACETDGLGHRVYKLDASLNDGAVLVKYSWYDRQNGSGRAEYQADADFMIRLQEIVSKYDFAGYNGYYHRVSGLPAMYGESLDIVYDSCERIYVHDNQSGFLPLEAEKALILLFGAAADLKTG